MALKRYRYYDSKKEKPMIENDPSAPANLPQDVKYVDWPSADYSGNEGYADGLHGIDEQIKADMPKMKKNKGKF